MFKRHMTWAKRHNIALKRRNMVVKRQKRVATVLSSWVENNEGLKRLFFLKRHCLNETTRKTGVSPKCFFSQTGGTVGPGGASVCCSLSFSFGANHFHRWLISVARPGPPCMIHMRPSLGDAAPEMGHAFSPAARGSCHPHRLREWFGGEVF